MVCTACGASIANMDGGWSRVDVWVYEARRPSDDIPGPRQDIRRVHCVACTERHAAMLAELDGQRGG